MDIKINFFGRFIIILLLFPPFNNLLGSDLSKYEITIAQNYSNFNHQKSEGYWTFGLGVNINLFNVNRFQYNLGFDHMRMKIHLSNITVLSDMYVEPKTIYHYKYIKMDYSFIEINNYLDVNLISHNKVNISVFTNPAIILRSPLISSLRYSSFDVNPEENETNTDYDEKFCDDCYISYKYLANVEFEYGMKIQYDRFAISAGHKLYRNPFIVNPKLSFKEQINTFKVSVHWKLTNRKEKI